MASKYKFATNPATGTLSDDDTKKYLSKVGIALFAFGMVSDLAQTLFVLAIRYIFGIFSFELQWLGIWLDIINEAIVVVSIYCIALPVLLAFLKKLPKIKPFKDTLTPKKFLGGFCVAMFCMMVGSYFSSAILSVIASITGSMPTNQLDVMISETNIWVTAVSTVIIAPILEEIVFRKIICDRLLPLGEGYAIFLSAAVFGLMHGNFYQFAYAFATGALFALIYVKTGRLSYSVVYHMAINFLGTIVTPWLMNQLDYERLEEILAAGTIDPGDPIIPAVMYIFAYEMATLALTVIGCILLSKAFKRKEFNLQTGILPPPKKGRFANIMLNPGTAALVAYFVLTLVSSLLL